MANTISSDFVVVLVILGIIGALLLVFQNPTVQGFTNPPALAACGVNIPPCAAGTKCINGFCRKAEPVPTVEKDPVPLLSDPTDISYAKIE